MQKTSKQQLLTKKLGQFLLNQIFLLNLHKINLKINALFGPRWRKKKSDLWHASSENLFILVSAWRASSQTQPKMGGEKHSLAPSIDGEDMNKSLQACTEATRGDSVSFYSLQQPFPSSPDPLG